nr:unnamed protein product [Callosobruchus analis]
MGAIIDYKPIMNQFISPIFVTKTAIANGNRQHYCYRLQTGTCFPALNGLTKRKNTTVVREKANQGACLIHSFIRKLRSIFPVSEGNNRIRMGAELFSFCSHCVENFGLPTIDLFA